MCRLQIVLAAGHSHGGTSLGSCLSQPIVGYSVIVIPQVPGALHPQIGFPGMSVPPRMNVGQQPQSVICEGESVSGMSVRLISNVPQGSPAMQQSLTV